MHNCRLAATHFRPQHSACIAADRVAAHLLQLLDDVSSCRLRTAADCCNSSCLQHAQDYSVTAGTGIVYLQVHRDCRLPCIQHNPPVAFLQFAPVGACCLLLKQ